MPMNTEDLNKLMAESAKDAINYIQTTHGLSVTLTQDDLTTVDTVLTKLAISQIPAPLSQENLFTVCSILGAFVGEIFKSTAGGEWFMDESVPDAPFVVLNYAGKSYPFASVCYEKIVNQPEVNLTKYFELALGGATQ